MYHTAQSRSFFNIGIEIRRGADALHLRGASALVTIGSPYLFRYTRKRNRVNIDHDKSHGPVRKGWNVLGKADTVSIGDDTVLIDARVIQRDAYTDDEKYRHEAWYFVKDALDRNGNRKGRADEVAGVVHAGEWVASQKLVASPVARPLIEALDYAQRTNTIGSLKSADVSRSITAPMALAQSQPQVIVQENKELKEIIARLSERLDEPFVTVNTVTGDMGIKQAQDEYQRLMNNKSPKSKRK